MQYNVCPSGNCGPKHKYMSCDALIFSGRGTLPTAWLWRGANSWGLGGSTRCSNDDVTAIGRYVLKSGPNSKTRAQNMLAYNWVGTWRSLTLKGEKFMPKPDLTQSQGRPPNLGTSKKRRKPFLVQIKTWVRGKKLAVEWSKTTRDYCILRYILLTYVHTPKKYTKNTANNRFDFWSLFPRV